MACEHYPCLGLCDICCTCHIHLPKDGHRRVNKAGELLGPYNLTTEEWRSYTFGLIAKYRTTYKIYNPVSLYYRKGGTTHRVVDDKGVTHCLPAPGEKGCVLRWFAPEEKVAF